MTVRDDLRRLGGDGTTLCTTRRVGDTTCTVTGRTDEPGRPLGPGKRPWGDPGVRLVPPRPQPVDGSGTRRSSALSATSLHAGPPGMSRSNGKFALSRSGGPRRWSGPSWRSLRVTQPRCGASRFEDSAMVTALAPKTLPNTHCADRADFLRTDWRVSKTRSLDLSAVTSPPAQFTGRRQASGGGGSTPNA